MKRAYLILTSAALLAFSAGTTYYLLQNPVRTTRPDRILVNRAEPDRVISPEALLVKPSGEEPDRDEAETPGWDASSVLRPEDSAATTSLTADGRPAGRRLRALDPDWQPGSTRVENPQPVTQRDGFTAPRWSPIGLDLAFTRPDFNSLWIACTTPGGRARLLADDPGVGTGFAWNVDGMSLYAPAPDGRFADILITGEKYPAPERTQRVFARDGRIWLRPEGDGEPLPLSGPEDFFHSPVLSPDESKVVFQGRETGLYMAAADGSRIIRIGPGEQPSWLPDSSGVVYIRAVYDHQGPVDGDLWYASADGRERTNITASPGVLETHPHVAPDGERIAFACDGAICVGRLIREPKLPR